jgi:S-adenosylmethionine decarboxylase
MLKLTLGSQTLVDLYHCNSKAIGDIKFVRAAMLEAAILSKATIVTDVFHEFNPQGLSGVVVIAESHIAFHSWPEFGCVSLDIFSCGNKMKPEIAIDHLRIAFGAQDMHLEKILRGRGMELSEQQILGNC